MDIAQTAATAQTAGTSPVRNKTTLSSDFETFLKMLTVQMQNQDPLNPVDSSEYAVQLATFSSVEQQVLTNDLLENMVMQMGAMGMAQLAGWVGMEARAAAPGFFDGAPISISPNPARLADEAYLVVWDADGDIVERSEIPVSTDTIDWAGVDDSGVPFANGLYSFEIESYAAGEHLATNVADVYSRIIEARGENGETVLVLEGGARIPANSISALRESG